MSTRFTGPLGLWGFPLINRLLEILGRSATATAPTAIVYPYVATAKTSAKNIEEWEWVDFRGQTRKLKVHREVE